VYSFGTNDSGYRGERLSEIPAFSLLKQSMHLGHTDAQYRIGTCLMYGRGCVYHVCESVRYLCLSAEAGNSISEYRFGDCLRNGIGVGKDAVQRFEFVKRSAAAGNDLEYPSLSLICSDRFIQWSESTGRMMMLPLSVSQRVVADVALNIPSTNRGCEEQNHQKAGH
jgi:TPR repeat protein